MPRGSPRFAFPLFLFGFSRLLLQGGLTIFALIKCGGSWLRLGKRIRFINFTVFDACRLLQRCESQILSVDFLLNDAFVRVVVE